MSKNTLKHNTQPHESGNSTFIFPAPVSVEIGSVGVKSVILWLGAGAVLN